jgi:hypothetical protein
MSTDDDTGNETRTEATFTRAQMAREVARQVREKVAASLAEYGDLDELRSKAAEADKMKSQLDRIEQRFIESEKRAEKAERETLTRRVADELGISMRLAGKLEGKSYAELLADGRDMIEDLGITPKGKKPSNDAADDGDTDGADRGEQDRSPQDREKEDAPPPREVVRRTRPREELLSGAPRTETAPEETDPLKLAALIPRR